jgi:hypothetical protein
VAIGDPQVPLETFLAMLEHHGLLGDDGMLAPDVGLLSIGDHFDYPAPTLERSRRGGLALLRWLAEHPPDRVSILLGNHDTSRVQELVGASDERYARGRVVAEEVRHLERAHGKHSEVALEARRRFHAAFPELPVPGLVERDYDSYSTAQRALVMALLLGGRVRLAAVGRLAGEERSLLLTHAGVTLRDLRQMGLEDERSPEVIASSLNRRLDEAVARVRPAWERGELLPLDLSPLHYPGDADQEGGGLLYHRPANPDRPGGVERPPDPAWEMHAERPRRFHPLELPAGLVQVCGHSGHRKCLQELVPWVTARARAMTLGGLRTLRAGAGGIVYDAGLEPGDPSEATLLMIDGELARVTWVSDYQVLSLGGIEVV